MGAFRHYFSPDCHKLPERRDGEFAPAVEQGFLRFVRPSRPCRPGIRNNVTAVIVDVILPCLNEASALPWIIEKMPADFRPIIVDNCFTDGSDELARSLGATVVPEVTVRGCVRAVRDMSEVLAR
jgi:hypothetical protein